MMRERGFVLNVVLREPNREFIPARPRRVRSRATLSAMALLGSTWLIFRTAGTTARYGRIGARYA
jgi:hypothetical protein